jgi:alanyl-tRNA synthetase
LGQAFSELKSQEKLIIQVIAEEEHAFLKTLSTGIKLLDQIILKAKAENLKTINGKSAFELYDTFGFPLDLTELILKEQDMVVDREGFDAEMQLQKSRSRSDAAVETDDWIIVKERKKPCKFIGYDFVEGKIFISKYRKVVNKGKPLYHLIFNQTPFYAESGGQVGDSGTLSSNGETIKIIDTKKENNLSIHITDTLPKNLNSAFSAKVDYNKRIDTECNHSATHLMHQALREILGKHVEQKGSLVHPDYLRFDFSHFQKLTDKEIRDVESFVNERIRQNIILDENRAVPFKDAVKLGAMALFGEKYGNLVRVIRFGGSVELCGGTHVKSTGQISYFKIISESAIAAGIRRIEAITGRKFEEYQKEQESVLAEIKSVLKNPQDILKAVEGLVAENSILQKKLEDYSKEKIALIRDSLIGKLQQTGTINIIAEKIEIDSAASMKDLAFQLKAQFKDLFLVLGAEIEGKGNLAVMISDSLVNERKLNAGNIIREIAKEINGGGGGQAFFATAGGKNPEGLLNAIEKAKSIISQTI